MRDDLIKLLNFKLKSITNNIDALNEVNGKIDDETNHLQFIKSAIDNFKGEDSCFDIYKFVNIDRETFNNLLMELEDSVLKTFGTNSCNYDGLVYLINGINNGISLSLTQEQVMSINLFIDKLLEKEKVYQDKILELNGEKQKLEITELDILKELQNKYSVLIEDVEEQKYVLDVNAIIDAIIYSDLSKEKTFEMLCFLLEYNANIYQEEKKDGKEKEFLEEGLTEIVPENSTMSVEMNETEVPAQEDPLVTNLSDAIDLTIPFEVNDNEMDISIETAPSVKKNYAQELSTTNELDKTIRLPEFNYVDGNGASEISTEFNTIEPVNALEETKGEIKEDKPQEVNISIPIQIEDFRVPFVENDTAGVMEDKTEAIKEPVDDDFSDLSDEDFDDYNPIMPSLETGFVDLNNKTIEDVANEEIKVPLEEPTVVETKEIPVVNEVKNTVSEPVAPQIIPVVVTPVTETTSKLDENEVKALFNEYGYKYDELDEVTKEILLKGNLDGYRNIFAKLKELNVLGLFEKNQETLVQILLYSSLEVIDEIVSIIGEQLSVDEDDKKITTSIVFKTMPSIFVKNDNGNYQNFIDNIKSFKEYGIDLIDLFDFSREVYVANHDLIVNNYNIVRSYDLTVNDHNAKYLLLLSNIQEKIDYYVEALYKDNLKGGHGDMFDGMDLIKLYPNKLNIVEAETIRRLRYSSENGRKIFGSKEKSLTGEITNLKVDVINMPDDYIRTFFNNEFDIISRDDVSKYEKLTSTNSFVELKLDDLLNKLEAYHHGMRYTIEGINISRNKVIRNYNILVNNGIDKGQALLFAICHNLMVTKDEYAKLKNVVQSLGGN